MPKMMCVIRHFQYAVSIMSVYLCSQAQNDLEMLANLEDYLQSTSVNSITFVFMPNAGRRDGDDLRRCERSRCMLASAFGEWSRHGGQEQCAWHDLGFAPLLTVLFRFGIVHSIL